MTHITEILARFIVGLQYEDIPKSVVETTKMYILDYYAACFAGIKVNDKFNKAIEDKKIAEQGALTAKFTLERMKLEAEAQKVKQASLSPLVLQEMAINKWNGQLPQYFSGEQLPFLTIK